MTRRTIQPLTVAGKNLLCLTFAGTLAATTAWGQASAPASQGPWVKKTAFDVVSVRAAKPDCSLLMVGPSHGRYTGRCVTLWALIYNAYEVRSLQDYPPGLPAWADQGKFDIEAKADDETTAAMEKLTVQDQGNWGRDMLQSLLADRFKLRVHYESRIQPIYELVPAKGGFKLSRCRSSRSRER